MSLILKLETLKKEHIKKEYELIHEYLREHTIAATIELSRSIPSKKIQVSLGGMGTNMALWLHDKNGKPTATYAEFLEPHKIPAKIRPLFQPLLTLQSVFNDVMALGYYPDLGNIVYNPLTKAVTHE